MDSVCAHAGGDLTNGSVVEIEDFLYQPFHALYLIIRHSPRGGNWSQSVSVPQL